MHKATRSLGKIKKHVALIHSSGDLGLLQRKIANILLQNAISYMEPSVEYEIPLKNLVANIHYTSNDYKHLKLALLKLVKTHLELNIFDEGFNENMDWVATTLLSFAIIKSNGVLYYGYSPIIEKLMFYPERYALIDLDVFMQLKSQYSAIIYENCYRFINLGQTPGWTIEEFRKLMCLEDDQYLEFKDLNKRVITHAIDEINSKSSLKLSAKTTRVGRKIAKIFFKIDDSHKRIFKPKINNKLLEVFNFTQREIDTLSNKYADEEIDKAITYVANQSSFKVDSIKDKKSYIRATLKNKYYAQSISSPTPIANLMLPTAKDKYVLNKGKEKEFCVFLQSNWKAVVNGQEEELFKSYLKAKGLMNLYVNDGIQHPEIVNSYISTFIANNLDRVPGEYLEKQNEKVFS